MPIINNLTPNRSYQLPAGPNLLSDDVHRLIAAIMAVDVDVANLHSSVAGRALLAHTHTIGDVTGLSTALASKQDASARGVANGYASLDATGKVPTSQLPAAVLGAMSYQGVWNANTNVPTIPAAAALNKGNFFKVTVAGTTDIGGINEWAVGDWIVSNGTSWDKIDNTDQVTSVAGRQGAVVLAKADVGLGNVDNTSDAAKPISTAVSNAIAPLVSGRLRGSSTGIQDWDNALENGWYLGGPTAANSPSAIDYHGIVQNFSTAYLVQTVTATTSTSETDTRMYRRTRMGGIWSSWHRLRVSEAELDARYLSPTAINIGNADTTLTRAAAGVLAVEGNQVPSPPGQADGDLIVRQVSGWGRLAKGTAGQLLTMNVGGTAPVWQDPAVSFYAGATQNETNYPIGHIILVAATSKVTRNSSAAISFSSDPAQFIFGTGNPLAGTWRARGVSGSGSEFHQLVQRVA